MRLWILSDLHADRGIEDIAVHAPEFDVFVCAGDVCSADIALSIEMVAAIARGKPAIFVAGNHEWAGGPRDVVGRNGRRAAERHNVHWLENQRVEINGVRFAGATLWTPENAHFAVTKMMLLLDHRRPDVVVTHFEPPADLLMRTGAKLWVCGHHHGFSDRTIADRRLIRNALGYPLDVHPIEAMPRQDYVVEFP